MPPPGRRLNGGAPAAAAAGTVAIAVPVPVYHAFDYLAPPGLAAGVRVRVPFGRGSRIGVVLGAGTGSDAARLRPVGEVLDDAPLLDDAMLGLLRWAARYYQHPIGEVMAAALPGLLRGGRQPAPERWWRLTAAGQAADAALLARAPRQLEAWRVLQGHPHGLPAARLTALAPALQRLAARGLAERCPPPPASAEAAAEKVMLTAAQRRAAEAVAADLGRWRAHVLYGVTGSGKTEVYFELIERVLAAGRQALVLIPEIGLSPQTLRRLRARISAPMAVLHSGLPDAERARAWLEARSGRARIVVGTRSAVWAPLPELGVVVVDEEHDPSYKQQEGFRYHARDVAVMRARRANVPVVLGSASPALETLYNVRSGRYRWHALEQRVNRRPPPALELVDLRRSPPVDGLSPSLLAALREELDAGGQALLFLNRRGFAPVLLCTACGWVPECERCDARLVLHRAARRLACHHCGAVRPVPEACPQCGTALAPVGIGTERVFDALRGHFPHAEVVRIDRDSTRRRGAMDAILERVHSGRARLLVGTQMLSKGHDFPQVGLVGIIDVDERLYGADFRASERLAQLVVQVAGRAGRGSRPGRVLLQTRLPDSPVLERLRTDGYLALARELLAEREATALPPCGGMALLRAEAHRRESAWALLEAARECLPAAADDVQVYGPMASAMERRVGRYRAQLVLQSARRRSLGAVLERWVPRVATLPQARRARWAIDVDPLETL